MLKSIVIAVTVLLLTSGCLEQDSPVAVTGNSGVPAENLIPDDLTVVWRSEYVTIAVKTSSPLGQYLATAAGASFLEHFSPDSYMRDAEGPVYSVPGVGKAVKGVDRVILNCLIVQDAAEQFAAHNDGVYACRAADHDHRGCNILDCLPNGHLLRNPIWHIHDSPVIAKPASGQVGYERHPSLDCGDGYHILGADQDANIICVITRIPADIQSGERARL